MTKKPRNPSRKNEITLPGQQISFDLTSTRERKKFFQILYQNSLTLAQELLDRGIQTGGIRTVFYFQGGVAKVFQDMDTVAAFLFDFKQSLSTIAKKPDWSAEAISGKLERVVLGVSKKSGRKEPGESPEEQQKQREKDKDFIGMYKTLPSITYNVI